MFSEHFTLTLKNKDRRKVWETVSAQPQKLGRVGHSVDVLPHVNFIVASY